MDKIAYIREKEFFQNTSYSADALTREDLMRGSSTSTGPSEVQKNKDEIVSRQRQEDLVKRFRKKHKPVFIDYDVNFEEAHFTLAHYLVGLIFWSTGVKWMFHPVSRDGCAKSGEMCFCVVYDGDR